MNETIDYFNRLKIGVAIAVAAVSAGCGGYVAGGGGYVDGGYVDGGYVGGGYVAAPVIEPDVTFYGGFQDRGRDVHAFRDRGFASRGVAHGAGGRAVGRR